MTNERVIELLCEMLTNCEKEIPIGGYVDPLRKDKATALDIAIEAIKEKITQKDDNLVGKMASEGTTPRRLTDLIGSLCDLTSGSGDKGTPIVYIQGYFDNYTN